jgi:hypothetical protein
MEPAQLHHSPSANADGLPILPTRTPTRAIAAAPPRPSCANGRTTAVLSVGNPARVGLASLPHPSRRWHRFGSELNTALIVHEAGGFRHCRGFPHVHARPPCGRSEAIAPWTSWFLVTARVLALFDQPLRRQLAADALSSAYDPKHGSRKRDGADARGNATTAAHRWPASRQHSQYVTAAGAVGSSLRTAAPARWPANKKSRREE